MRKFTAALVLGGLLTTLALGVVCVQSLQAQTAKRKAPPRIFDKRVEDAFFKDVAQQHGEGTFADVLSGRAVVKTPMGSSGNDTSPTANPGTGSGWSKIISADTLESEIKGTINSV